MTAFLVAVFLIALIFAYLYFNLKVEFSRKLVEMEKAFELQLDYVEQAAKEEAEELMKQREKYLRRDAAKRSRATMKGRIVEQIAPYLENFSYLPQDCRFLGSPIDFVVFNGMSDGKIQEIVLVEVKTGNSRLSSRERQVRDVVGEKLVRYETFRSTKTLQVGSPFEKGS